MALASAFPPSNDMLTRFQFKFLELPLHRTPQDSYWGCLGVLLRSREHQLPRVRPGPKPPLLGHVLGTDPQGGKSWQRRGPAAFMAGTNRPGCSRFWGPCPGLPQGSSDCFWGPCPGLPQGSSDCFWGPRPGLPRGSSDCFWGPCPGLPRGSSDCFGFTTDPVLCFLRTFPSPLTN